LKVDLAVPVVGFLPVADALEDHKSRC
jgi:hypothetical protein